MHSLRTLIAATLLAGPAIFAQDSSSPAAPATPSSSAFDPSIKRVGVTVSPIHFLLGFEGAAEFLVTPRVGVVGIFGTGSVDAGELKFSWREIGAQGRYYFKDGEGFHLGAEVMSINVELDENSIGDAMAAGLAVGPLLGWKGVWGTGFTLDVQGGFQYISSEAEAKSGDAKAKDGASTGIPLLNLDLGWSF